MSADGLTRADKLAHRRANLARVIAITLLAGQVAAFASPADRLSVVGQGGGMIWALAVLAFLGFGSGWLHGPSIHAALNDEGTIAHRRAAFSLGFWVALTTAGALWILALRTPVAVTEALRLVISLSVAIALLRFATLEKRALVGD